MQLFSFRELCSDDLAFVRNIYEQAFPAWEREDFAQLLSRGTDDGVQQYACVVEEQIIGLATLSPLWSVRWNFLEYFALAQNCRSQGLGSRFWNRIEARIENPVVIEVEDPAQSGLTAEEVSTRQARIRFWRRAGFDEIPVPNYRVPRADGDSEHFEPLLLMSTMPPVPPLCSPETLTAALYSEGYGLADAQQRAAASQIHPLHE